METINFTVFDLGNKYIKVYKNTTQIVEVKDSQYSLFPVVLSVNQLGRILVSHDALKYANSTDTLFENFNTNFFGGKFTKEIIFSRQYKPRKNDATITVELSSYSILFKIFSDLKERLGKQLFKDIMIIVPNQTTEEEKKLLKEMFEELEVNRFYILNSALSAMKNYMEEQKGIENGNYVVFDYGITLKLSNVKVSDNENGTFLMNEKCLQFNNKKFELIDCMENTEVGGNKIDNILKDYVLKILRAKNEKIAKHFETTSTMKFMGLMDNIKISLNTTVDQRVCLQSFSIKVRGRQEQVDDVEIKRDEDFNTECEQTFVEVLGNVKQFMERNSLTNETKIYSIGGSSNLFYIQDGLKTYGKVIDPENKYSAIAKGGAHVSELVRQSILNDPNQVILNSDICLKIFDNVLGVNRLITIFKKGIRLPVKNQQFEYYVHTEKQTRFVLKFYKNYTPFIIEDNLLTEIEIDKSDDDSLQLKKGDKIVLKFELTSEFMMSVNLSFVQSFIKKNTTSSCDLSDKNLKLNMN